MKRLITIIAVTALCGSSAVEASDLLRWNVRSMVPPMFSSYRQPQRHHHHHQHHQVQPHFVAPSHAVPVYGGSAFGAWDHHAQPAHHGGHHGACVKYKDLRNIAPCAKPLIVAVPDPCACKCKRSCDPCAPCAPPKMVSVKICVPSCTCGPPCVTRSKCGKYVRYDFGKYAVDIRSKKGYVEVDYDD